MTRATGVDPTHLSRLKSQGRLENDGKNPTSWRCPADLTMKYLVFDPERPAGSGWLCLEGLSCYAKWVTLASNATPLSLILASDWAAAYGSGYAVVISVDRAHEEPSLMAAYQETKARQLQATSPWGVYVG